MPVVMQRCGYVDDDAARLLEAGERSLAHVEGAEQVYVEHGLEGVEAEVLGGTQEVACENTPSNGKHNRQTANRKRRRTRSAVDEYVYCSPLLHHLRHSAFTRSHAAHVTRHVHRAAAARADCSRSSRNHILAAAEERNFRAKRRQRLGDAEADAAAAACDCV